ncbi:phosphatidylethanolamine N-methyltransferase isoform X2 [Anarrhichthys ocellatus]|uniref:phosphatidylethanolamine N-methyltransferase isoform X2 n=1 Tax=Anarrhichthys ocellatus TaxID=433405 RepID=UPI0012EE655A|nr:phosphatidylethanolamine N-methyltransferase isoform X2 [Anarrhichthys ocellatus]
MSDVAAVQDDNPARETRSVPLDCCGGLNNVDYSKMDLTLIEGLLKHTNFHDSSFYLAVVAIVFNPFFWNVVARWEHRTRTLSRLFGSPYLACYCLGFVIILLNVYRSHSMTVAMKSQTKWEVMDRTDVFYAGVALMVLGTVLVVGSFLALGFTGTFLDLGTKMISCRYRMTGEDLPLLGCFGRYLNSIGYRYPALVVLLPRGYAFSNMFPIC